MIFNYSTNGATFSLNVTRCYDVSKNAATTAISFSIRIVRAYILRRRHFFNVTLPTIALVKTVWHSKNVTRSIDQLDHRKLTLGIRVKMSPVKPTIQSTGNIHIIILQRYYLHEIGSNLKWCKMIVWRGSNWKELIRCSGGGSSRHQFIPRMLAVFHLGYYSASACAVMQCKW